MPTTPYIIGFKCYQSDEATVAAGETVTAKHESSGEIQSATVASDGSVAFDMANFISYSNSDYITFTISNAGTVGQELRMKAISHNNSEISEIKVEYEV